MLKVIRAINTLLGTVVSLAVLAALAAGSWYAYNTFFQARWDAERALRDREAQIVTLTDDLRAKSQQLDQVTAQLLRSQEQIDELEKDLQAKQREIDRLSTANRLLKVDHRLARIDVLSQEGSAEDGSLKTTFKLVEVDDQGKPIDRPRTFTIAGDVVYVDSWVVKFTDDFVELGDPLRGTALCLLRRVFGEKQQPAEGFAIDSEDSQPPPYRPSGPPSELEQEIWSRFWFYANNSKEAEEKGIRAAHGVAPSMKLIPGKRYRLELRSTGGLTFKCEGDIPAGVGEVL